MDALSTSSAISLRLHVRNKVALLYSYLFPTIFLVAFWVLYRFEQVPLVRHVGELLTVTALGGACFGLPTTMVSERERGVWRRYRLTPVSTATLVSARSPPAIFSSSWRGVAATRARHGPRHALAAASLRALPRVHVCRIRVHRARPRDCDDGRQRARGAGARTMHLPADADHRWRRGSAREPSGLGAAPVSRSFPDGTPSTRCRRASPAMASARRRLQRAFARS